MSQQDELEARYRSEAEAENLPPRDPFPQMIVVCIGITMVLLIVIMGFLFVDFVIIRPNQSVRPTPVTRSPTPSTPQTATIPEKPTQDTLNP